MNTAGLFCLLCESGFESLCELIGAGGASGTALGALKTCDNVGCLHSCDELRNALGVAVSSANELNGIDHAVGDLNLDLAGTSTLGCVFNVLCHNHDSFLSCFFRRDTMCFRYYSLYHIFLKKIAFFDKKIIFVYIAQKLAV